jgi:hypothetical protein
MKPLEKADICSVVSLSNFSAAIRYERIYHEKYESNRKDRSNKLFWGASNISAIRVKYFP